MLLLCEGVIGWDGCLEFVDFVNGGFDEVVVFDCVLICYF